VILPPHTAVFGLLAVIIALLIMRTLTRWSASPTDPFEVRDLFMESGRASRGATVLLLSFASTTWFFVFYSLTGRMTEGYFGLYVAAWIAPTVARMITNSTPATPVPKAVTTTTTTETKATQ